MRDNNYWKEVISKLKAIAIEKYGENGYQTILAEKTGFDREHLNRLFNLRQAPTLNNFIKIVRAIYNLNTYGALNKFFKTK